MHLLKTIFTLLVLLSLIILLFKFSLISIALILFSSVLLLSLDIFYIKG